MFEEHFEASSFLEAHSEYDVTYDSIGLNFYSQHNATGHHNSDLYETSYADYGRRPRDQQQQQNRSFTNGLEFGQDGTEENNGCENDGNEAYNFIRENLGRRSFPLDKASHVIVQNEQMKVSRDVIVPFLNISLRISPQPTAKLCPHPKLLHRENFYSSITLCVTSEAKMSQIGHIIIISESCRYKVVINHSDCSLRKL